MLSIPIIYTIQKGIVRYLQHVQNIYSDPDAYKRDYTLRTYPQETITQ